MANDWMFSKVGDVFDLIPGFAFKSKDFRPSGTPVLKIKNVKANQIVLDDLSYVDPSFLESKSRYTIRRGDLLITMSGNRFDGSPDTWVGKVAQFRHDRPILLNQRVGILRPRAEIEVDRRFCSYLLSSKAYQELFIAIATSSGGQANLSPRQIFSADMSLPPLREQRRIAHILGTLDDKIELNRRMNETLEKMARALFKSWFVDFDPVRAKLDGRQPAGMDADTAALFPDRFEHTELGLVPEGWRIGPLPDAIHVNPKRVLRKGDIAPYLDMKNMPTAGHRAEGWIDREFGSGTKFISGDTLLARITPCLENGKTAFVDFLDDGHVGWGSTEYIIFHPKPPLPVEFGYYLARSEGLRLHAIQNMTGTSGRQRVPPTCFEQFPVVVPTAPVAKRFGELVRPLMRRIGANCEQSSELGILQNALLPKLLSGEISLGEAATTIAGVV